MYVALKYIHILSAIIMIGTTAANGLIEVRAFRREDAQLSAFTMEIVMLFNHVFMLPSLIILPASGLLLALDAGFPLNSPWLLYSILLVIGLWAAFIIGHGMEKRMSRLAAASAKRGEKLPAGYYQIFNRGKWVGIFATVAALLILYMMIAKRPPFM